METDRRRLAQPGKTGRPGHRETIEVDSPAYPARSSLVDASISERTKGFRIRTEFEDRGTVGVGGMAEVRQVFDRFLQRLVAAKILRPGLSQHSRDRFVQEARITGQLEHPNIIPVHALAADRFTMKLVQGETLAEQLERSEAPPRNEALAEVVRQLMKVCDALSFAHSRGVIHRDVKSENIMLGRFGEVYLVDWGVALVLGSDETRRPASVVGTPAFMSPEAAHGELGRTDARSDVFGLGAVLYEALTLQPPHRGHDAEQVLRAARRCVVQPPHVLPGGVGQPAALCDIAMKALQADPAERHQNVDQLREALDAFLQSGAWFARRHVVAGTDIVREGASGQEAYIVEHGHCEVFRGQADDREYLRTLGPGDVFGELSFFVSEVRTATVRARDDVSLLVLTRDTLERQFPVGSWPRHFLDTLAERFWESENTRSLER